MPFPFYIFSDLDSMAAEFTSYILYLFLFVHKILCRRIFNPHMIFKFSFLFYIFSFFISAAAVFSHKTAIYPAAVPYIPPSQRNTPGFSDLILYNLFFPAPVLHNTCSATQCRRRLEKHRKQWLPARPFLPFILLFLFFIL